MRINIPSRRNITTSKFWSQETSCCQFYRFSVETFQPSSIYWFGEKLNQKNSVRNGFDSSFCVSNENVSIMFRLVWTFRSQGKQVRNKNQTVTNWKIHFQSHWRERKKQRNRERDRQTDRQRKKDLKTLRMREVRARWMWWFTKKKIEEKDVFTKE